MNKNTEATATAENATKEGASISVKKDSAYSLISRNLTESDLKNVAVVRMIINERDNLQADNTELKEWEQKFHIVDKENGVLRGKFKTFTAFEILSTGTIAVGSVLSGSALSPFNSVLFSLGIILIGSGILAKTIKIL